MGNINLTRKRKAASHLVEINFLISLSTNNLHGRKSSHYHIRINSPTLQEKIHPKFDKICLINTKILFWLLSEILRIIVLYFTLFIYNVALDTEMSKTVHIPMLVIILALRLWT